jgi:membrane protein YqaA with SNARE-associated domain
MYLKYYQSNKGLIWLFVVTLISISVLLWQSDLFVEETGSHQPI